MSTNEQVKKTLADNCR